MSTPIDSWVASWLCVIRSQPAGDWIIHGNDAERVGGIFGFENPHHDNSNLRSSTPPPSPIATTDPKKTAEPPNP